MRFLAALSVLPFAAACGDDGGSTPAVDAAATSDAPPSTIDASIDAAPLALALTSTAFAEGGVIPLAHVCTAQQGQNQSPPLAWTGAPAGTQSFAVVFTDKSNGLIHSIIYDIPATVTSLPLDVDKVYAPPDVPGAHQTTGYNNTTRGYLGPCPPNMHTYEFALYALDVATLPGATMATTRTEALPAITDAMIGVARLSGTHTP